MMRGPCRSLRGSRQTAASRGTEEWMTQARAVFSRSLKLDVGLKPSYFANHGAAKTWKVKQPADRRPAPHLQDHLGPRPPVNPKWIELRRNFAYFPRHALFLIAVFFYEPVVVRVGHEDFRVIRFQHPRAVVPSQAGFGG